MHWIDRIEKVGRLVLWLTLASAVVLVPLMYINLRRSAEAQLEESARQAEQRKLQEAEGAKENRMPLRSLGPILTNFSESTATGRAWFSNVSPRSGVLCIAGVVTNPRSKATTESLATCKQISAYASNVEMEVMFAGAVLTTLCKGVSCSFSLKDAPDVGVHPPALAEVAVSN